MSAEPSDLARGYDAERFRQEGHALVDRLARYLSEVDRYPVSPLLPVEELESLFPVPNGTDSPEQLLDRLLEFSTHLHSRGFVGHQVSAPHPSAALSELVSALLNNGMAVREMGPAGTAIESAIVRWLADKAGFPADSQGAITSGGSLANLTAILAARQAQTGFDPWTHGVAAGPPLALLCSDQAHYSIERSAAIVGLGRDGCIAVPSDAAGKMQPAAVRAGLQQARAAGRRPIALIASSCGTATGSFDPLEPLADLAAEEDLWLHVDAAHGAAALLSARHRDKLRGVERADSLTADAHKMMLMPALSSIVLFRDRARGAAAFAQDASYLFDSEARHDVGLRTFECTKRLIGWPLYQLLACGGERLIETHYDRAAALAETFADLIEATPEFRLALRPESNIVCFRYEPAAIAPERFDALQLERRQAVNRSGEFYLVKTAWRGQIWLRVVLMNPRLELSDLERLLDRLRRS